MAKLIFIFSLPRSGSTLLQRLLLSSGNCATLGEPSLLLRFLGGDALSVRKSTYWEYLVELAKDDMRAHWPGFDDAYRAGVRELMSRIYDGLSGGKEWFIDKTPRYTLIADEIIKVFPDAKFIVLWRHPLAVAASMAEKRDYWYVNDYSIDLYGGLARLDAFSKRHKEAICELRYEDLVASPEQVLARVGTYLGWKDLAGVLSGPLASARSQSLGDQTGVRKYDALSCGSKDSWKKNYNNWYRRCWARRYTSNEGIAPILESHGYEPLEASGALQSAPIAGLVECLRVAMKTSRENRHPAWLKRFSSDFRKHNDYDAPLR